MDKWRNDWMNKYVLESYKWVIYNNSRARSMGSQFAWILVWSRGKSVCQKISYIQFSSVAQSCPTLCNPMNCSTPGFPVHHQLPELAQTHVHRVSDAIQPWHPPWFLSPPAFNLFLQHQGLFQWVSSSHQVARVLELQLQQQSFQWIFGTDFL